MALSPFAPRERTEERKPGREDDYTSDTNSSSQTAFFLLSHLWSEERGTEDYREESALQDLLLLFLISLFFFFLVLALLRGKM